MTLQTISIEKKLSPRRPAFENMSMETFRRNYISIMEQTGAQLEYIDTHQGRYQNTVAKKTYLRDNYGVVMLMRPFVDRFFDDSEVTTLRAPGTK